MGTILTDRDIRQRCETPEYKVVKADGHSYLISGPLTKSQEQIFKLSEVFQSFANGNVPITNVPDKQKVLPVSASGIIKATEEEISNHRPLISPFFASSQKILNGNRVMSYGCSSHGYDARISNDLRIFTNINSTIIDPYDIDSEKCMVQAELKVDEKGNEYIILPPNSFALGHTVEYFVINKDVTVICLGKSTYARAGVSVIVTPLESEWEGQVVIEIVNCTTLPVKIYTNVGICQFMFLQSDESPDVSYADRSGKYQSQTGVTLGKV